MQSQGQILKIATANGEIVSLKNENYNGFTDCIMKTLHKEGMFGFYRGLTVNFAKSVPAISVSYLAFEKCKEIFKNYV